MAYTTCLRSSDWVPRRQLGTLLAIGVAVVALFAGPAFASSQPVSGLVGASGGNSGGAKPTHAGWSRLSARTRSSISAALGRSVPGYEVRTEQGRLKAENGAQNLELNFTGQGVRVRRASQLWGMTLRGYGYGAAIKPVRAAIPVTNLNRVEYRRGTLTEWYVNGPAGLEQGFTLQKPPGRADGRRVTIALALSGNLTASVDADGRGLALFAADGSEPVRYRGLTAYDAAGRKLPAWLNVKRDRLLLNVNDTEARYPVVIDPWVQSAQLSASDAADNDELGASVAVSGDVVVAGEPGCQGCGIVGAAYVFTEPPSGWANATQTAKLTASDGAANNQFGFAVSIDGNTIVVGAHGTDGGQGAAYVYVEPETGWVDSTETAKLTGIGITNGDLLGRSVSISGNTIVLGAPLASTGYKFRPGALYVYAEPETGWANMTQTAKLTASDGTNGAQLGYSVGIDGNTVVGGAVYKNLPSPPPGAAYVFVEPETGWANMTQTAKLTSSDGASGDRLGNFVAISGNTVVAGAPRATIGSQAQQGAAYVFVEPGSGWVDMTQTAKLTASDGQAGSLFGRSVAINATTVVVGAPSQKVGSDSFEGAVYEFDEPPAGWMDMTQSNELNALTGAVNLFLGGRVGVNGTTLAAGADGWPGGSRSGNSRLGTAFVFSETQ